MCKTSLRFAAARETSENLLLIYFQSNSVSAVGLERLEAITHEAEAKTHEAEATTHEAEARFFGLEARPRGLTSSPEIFLALTSTERGPIGPQTHFA